MYHNSQYQIYLLANQTTAQNPEQAEDAIEHMCFLTDAHRLYSHALGVYDLELTLMVAQQAQMVRRSRKVVRRH